MKTKNPPAIAFIFLLAALPLLAETIYTPALPDIAHSLSVPDSWVEYTLTIYLLGFALGTLFWGKLSDKLGRKPCLLAGYAFFVVGCIGCYFASGITTLLTSRLIQAFGGSVGSVICQAITRDSYHGPELGRAFSTLAGTLAFTPAIGPVIGGVMDQTLGWTSIFLLMIILAAIVWLIAYFRLQETHYQTNKEAPSVRQVFWTLAQNQRIIGFGVLVACANGMTFSYFAEGSFYMIDLLGLTPALYGVTFIGIAATGLLGGSISRRLQSRLEPLAIMQIGIRFSLIGSSLFVALLFAGLNSSIFALLTMLCMMVINLGSYTVIPNALSLALKDYQGAIGTASSLFGFFYFTLISLITLGMGALHNATLYPMPLYFCALALVMQLVYSALVVPVRSVKRASLL